MQMTFCQEQASMQRLLETQKSSRAQGKMATPDATCALALLVFQMTFRKGLTRSMFKVSTMQPPLPGVF